MTQEREGKGFFQRMDSWLNSDKSASSSRLNKADLIGSMSRRGNSFANYDDYYDDYGSSLNRAGYGHHGSHSGHGGHGYCQEDQVSIGLLVVSLAGIALMFYTLLTKIQANGGRKKRDDDMNTYFPLQYIVSFFETDGLEDFENKIDKIASGVDDGENNWINAIYNKYGNGTTTEESDEVVGNIEGLEPPMLDETWGLKDGEDNKTSKSKSKRNSEPIDDQFEKEFNEIYDNDGTTCKTKMWRCFSRVAEGSLHHLHDPEGITGLVKNTLFKIAFNGAKGGMWNTLMSIPEARKVQLCMNAHDKCSSKEVLKNELADENSNDNRFLINPEFVESLDDSDGSKAFNVEGEGTEGFN